MGLLGKRCPFPSQTIDQSSTWSALSRRTNLNYVMAIKITTIMTTTSTQRRYNIDTRVYHRCGWFSTIHIRLRLCSISNNLRRVPRACHNDVACSSSSRGFVTLVQRKIRATSTRKIWCTISKGGEDGRDRLRITITWRVIYVLPSLCLQEIGEVCCASFDHGKDHRTQEIIMKEDKRVDVTSKGAMISKGGNSLMEL